LATDPSLLLLDEPFGALDPLVRRDIRVWLRALQQRLGLTTVMVTHDRQEAMEIADRVAVLRGGKLLQIDTPAVLEAAPADAFVMRFLGETLEFPGRVEAGVFTPVSSAIAPFAAPPGRAGEAVALIRPWQVRLSPAPDGAQIDETHPAGAFHRISLTLPGTGAAFEILSPAELPTPARGQRMRIELLTPRLFTPKGEPIR
ncbi:sulfate ABC transporter ATP-binding protein, partial [Endobacter medicaginis]|nr:sulfate ABC transporter ATP-binding protein [Endobacter medicaginis]